MRLTGATAPVAWLLMPDLPAFAFWALGALMLACLWVAASRLARFEVRLRGLRRDLRGDR